MKCSRSAWKEAVEEDEDEWALEELLYKQHRPNETTTIGAKGVPYYYLHLLQHSSGLAWRLCDAKLSEQRNV